MQERRNRIITSETARITVQLNSLPIMLDLDGAAQAWQQTLSLARKHRLTLYDSLYLELALRKQLPLASFDVKLCVAAMAEQVMIVTGEPQ